MLTIVLGTLRADQGRVVQSEILQQDILQLIEILRQNIKKKGMLKIMKTRTYEEYSHNMFQNHAQKDTLFLQDRTYLAVPQY